MNEKESEMKLSWSDWGMKSVVKFLPAACFTVFSRLAYSSTLKDWGDVFVRNVSLLSTGYTVLYPHKLQLFVTTSRRASVSTVNVPSPYLPGSSVLVRIVYWFMINAMLLLSRWSHEKCSGFDLGLWPSHRKSIRIMIPNDLKMRVMSNACVI
jgi:hypothetical protein